MQYKHDESFGISRLMPARAAFLSADSHFKFQQPRLAMLAAVGQHDATDTVLRCTLRLLSRC